MFNENACASPCKRFVRGAVDAQTGMIKCARCDHWFVDDDPTVDDEEGDE
jgi:hypothetical protein